MWDDAGEATLEARADSVDALFSTALTALLLLARGEVGQGEVGPEPDASVSIPVRGQGADYTEVFSELCGDLLAQVEGAGTGISRVRMDGILETDTGYTAWGYALGNQQENKPANNLMMLDRPSIGMRDDSVTLAIRVGRSA
jgi:hypothetical protein